MPRARKPVSPFRYFNLSDRSFACGKSEILLAAEAMDLNLGLKDVDARIAACRGSNIVFSFKKRMPLQAISLNWLG
jgi:hypothetical protein